jgi:MYXO-CTERM domain-containing protein
MRTVSKLCLALVPALSVSTPAAAIITIGLVQVGGTYSASVGAKPGDTLVVSIWWSVGPGDTLALIQPAIVFDGSVQSFSPDVYGSPPGLSTEDLYPATFAGPSGPPASKRDMNFLTYGDIGLNPLDPNMAVGWEKAAPPTGWVIGPCTAGSCSSLGTAFFVLSGLPGVIAIGGVGQPGGTLVLDSTFTDIAGDPTKVRILPLPEPATAGLLVGLVAVAALAATRRRHRH